MKHKSNHPFRLWVLLVCAWLLIPCAVADTAVVTEYQDTVMTEHQGPLMTADKAKQAEYIGTENCKLCHIMHFESWSSTRMSKAYELLKPGARIEAKQKAGLDPTVDYTQKNECVRCHVTGFGRPGGFVNLEETPDMIGVQCEMCHGPGSIYTEMMMKQPGTYIREDYITQGGLTMPSPENNVCTQQCHNPNSPFIKSGFEFDFTNRKASGTHRHDLEYIYIPFDY